MSHLSTSNSDETGHNGTGIRHFLGRLLTFLVPFIIIGLTLEYALWKTGDLWTPEYALHHQQQSTTESIYGPRFFSDQFNLYKLSGIRYRQPSILAIGSSRVMQIRDIMFHPVQDEFYNGGGLLRNAFDLDAFSTMLAQEQLPLPQVLIVGIDPWWIRTNDGKNTWLHNVDERYSFAGHIEAFRQTFKNGALKKIITATGVSESPYYGYEAIGTWARLEGTGFRKDGSSLYFPKVFLEFVANPVYVDRESPSIIDRIRMTRKQFALPAMSDERRVMLIIDAMARIKNTGVEVVALMPPFSTEAFDALEDSPPLKTWWNFYKNEFPMLLEQHGITVLPVSHPTQYGLDDTYMFDGWHPSEVYMAHLVKSLIEQAPQSSYLKNANTENLSALIDTATIPLAFTRPDHPM